MNTTHRSPGFMWHWTLASAWQSNRNLLLSSSSCWRNLSIKNKIGNKKVLKELKAKSLQSLSVGKLTLVVALMNWFWIQSLDHALFRCEFLLCMLHMPFSWLWRESIFKGSLGLRLGFKFNCYSSCSNDSRWHISWSVPITKGTCAFTRTPQANAPQTNKQTNSPEVWKFIFISIWMCYRYIKEKYVKIKIFLACEKLNLQIFIIALLHIHLIT